MYLPPELTSQILSYLPVRDWVAACGVSTHWRAAGLETGQLRQRGWPDYKSLKRTHHMVCSFCHKNRARIRATTGRRECPACKTAPGRQLITRTRALNEYKLKPAQLEDVPCIACTNPYGSRHDMRLYRVSDLPMSWE